MRRYWSSSLRVIKLWVIIEALFYVYYRHRLARAQSSRPNLSSSEEWRNRRLKFVERAVRTAKMTSRLPHEGHIAVQKWIRGWFLGAPFSSISHKAASSILSTMIFGAKLDALSPILRSDLHSYVELLEAGTDTKFSTESGTNDPFLTTVTSRVGIVKAFYRPLIVYSCVAGVKMASRMILSMLGFSRRYSGPVSYYYHPGSALNDKPALVFLHGIGVGFLPYLVFVSKLLASGREVYLFEMPWIAMSFGSHRLTSPEFRECVESALGSRDICLIGHSLGTCITNWLLNSEIIKVVHLVLIEPPTLLAFLPHVILSKEIMQPAFNRHAQLSRPKYMLSLLVHLFAMKELGVAETLDRGFAWSDMIMFAEDFPERTTVVLSVQDSIVPSRKIERYLKRYQEQFPSNDRIDIIKFEHTVHAGFIASPTLTDQLVETICSD